MKRDSDIRQDVEAELRRSANVDMTDVAATVCDGVVILTGYVRDFFHKYNAEDAVKRVADVVAIVNDIEVLRPQSPAIDPQLAREAISALERQLPLYAKRIRPTVRQGIITLEGMVDENDQREEAERAVRGVRGTVGVINAITLSPSAKALHPEHVKQVIDASFRGSTQHGTGDLTVEADTTGVILRGHVRTWAERSQAERSAWSAPGVRSVRNELTVQA